jgi:hypothetical protein
MARDYSIMSLEMLVRVHFQSKLLSKKELNFPE